MKRSIILLLFVLASNVWGAPAKAGLFFCNQTGLGMHIAVGWFEQGRWLSKGWYHLNPQECGSTLLGILEHTYYYYYAETDQDKLKWDGSGSNEGYFCTSDDAFFYVNNNTNCKGHTFKKLIVGDADQFTQPLTETQTDPKQAALNCQNKIINGTDAFAKCWMRNVATSKQRAILDCYDKTTSFEAFAICANKDNVSPDAYKVANCASEYNLVRAIMLDLTN